MEERQVSADYLLDLASLVCFYYIQLGLTSYEGKKACSRCGGILNHGVAKLSELLYGKPLCGKCVNEQGLASVVATDVNKANQRVKKMESEIVKALCQQRIEVNSDLIKLLGLINNFYGAFYSWESTVKNEKK